MNKQLANFIIQKWQNINAENIVFLIDKNQFDGQPETFHCNNQKYI